MNIQLHISGWSRVGAACTFILMSLVALAPANAQKPNDIGVSVQAPQEMYVGDTAELLVQVNGSRDVAAPPMPALPAFDIAYAGPHDNSSQMTIIINGKVDARTTVVYSHAYTITAKRAGRFTIPSIEVTVEGQRYATQPVSMVVKEPALAKDSALTVALDRTEAFVGEPVRVTITWALGLEVRGYQLGMPIDAPDDSFDLVPGPDPRPAGTSRQDNRFLAIKLNGQDIIGTMGQTQLNGKTVRAIVVEQIIIPKKPGVIHVGPTRVDLAAVVGQRQRRPFDSVFDDLAMVERQYVQAPALELAVRDLPTTGRPTDFSGLVGNYSIEAAADAKDAAIGDPINLAVTVTGPYPLSLVPPLDLSRQPSLRGKFRLPRDPILGAAGPTAARFDAVIRPRTADITQIGPIEISYFDPESKAYKVATTKPLPLTVRAGTQVGMTDTPDGDDDMAASAHHDDQPLPNGLAGISRDPLPVGESAFELGRVLHRPSTLGLLAAPPLIYAAAAVALGIRRRHDRDPALRRRLRAARTFRSAVRGLNAGPHTPAGLDVLARALANFASDLAGEHADALTAQQAASVFADAGSVAGSGAKLADLVRAIEIERFGIRDSAEPLAAPLPADPVAESLRLVRAFVKQNRSGRAA